MTHEVEMLVKAVEAILVANDKYGYGAAHNILNDTKRNDLRVAVEAVKSRRP